MSKKIKTTTTLVIVESPAKCKKIEEYLGQGYKCVATYGHLRTISSLKNINIANNFEPTYSLLNESSIKKKQFEILQREIKKANDVILASDLDREGEMISYSIIELFDLPITTKRITFNEITQESITRSVLHPKTIDMNLVNAQKARQIVDILVGFKISPLLWKLICAPKGKDNSLSAGRCQTPALKLIYENQKEIDNSSKKKVYNTIGYFTNANLPFELNTQIEEDSQLLEFLNNSITFSHIYTCSLPIKKTTTSPEPFTTSRLQQTASNKLHLSPKETMQICQKLYEGGYITYMRTDSKVYSNEFMETVSKYIVKNYTEQYIKNQTMCYAQEAHEAIRPTNIFLQDLPDEIESKSKKMYKLIWTNALESCMEDSTCWSLTATISAPSIKSSIESVTNSKIKYSYTTELPDFLGWKIVENKLSRENKEFQYLSTIAKDSIVRYNKISSHITCKGVINHYTEARVVQLLEEKGIGRPSTFSYLIDKIQEKGYVKKKDCKGVEINCVDFELVDGNIQEIATKREFGNEKGKLIIQELGILVLELLENKCSELFNYEYTRTMEVLLDKIAKGETVWTDVCSTCNKEIDDLLATIKDESKYEIKIDDSNTYMIGKYGPIVKCVEDKNGKQEVTFKTIKPDVDMSKIKTGECNINDIIEISKTKSIGQYQGNDVILRKGKFGLYASWGEKSKTLKELGNRPIENITFEEVTAILEKETDTCSGLIRKISNHLSIKTGAKGDYIFYKNQKMKKPLFFDIKKFSLETKEDYKVCDVATLQSWISAKYAVK